MIQHSCLRFSGTESQAEENDLDVLTPLLAMRSANWVADLRTWEIVRLDRAASFCYRCSKLISSLKDGEIFEVTMPFWIFFFARHTVSCESLFVISCLYPLEWAI